MLSPDGCQADEKVRLEAQKANENGALDCLPVIEREGISISCDQCLFDEPLVLARIACPLPSAFNAYTETVKLLKEFARVIQQAPEGTASVEFPHKGWSKRKGVFVSETWSCKVVASVENGLRTLTFTDVTAPPSKGIL